MSTHTDMGSGRFADESWTRAAYMHNMRVQTWRDGAMADFDGSQGLFTTDPQLYDIDPHFNSGSNWGSYIYVGGPGSG
jgi:Neprosin